jgi:hypothetical protein
VPVLIYNNKEVDAALLERFSEPSWNNPVARFLDHDGKDIIARADGVWSPHEIANRMIATLRAKQRAVPLYLELARDEAVTATRREIAFAMACFWAGEGKLGALDGVVATRVGFVESHEVVLVEYLADRLPAASLIESALEFDCAKAIYSTTDLDEAARSAAGDRLKIKPFEVRAAAEGDDKHALRATPYFGLPLTPGQATRMNADAFAGRDPSRWLSTRQQALKRDPAK